MNVLIWEETADRKTIMNYYVLSEKEKPIVDCHENFKQAQSK